MQRYHDNAFDRKFGADTSEFIPLQDLTIVSENIAEGIRYKPMSAAVFNGIMDRLDIDFSEFEFIDFGSGKGRVLLLASGYGFRKTIGVKFARELHDITIKNIEAYEIITKKSIRAELICEDAAKLPIPDSPLVLFFIVRFRAASWSRSSTYRNRTWRIREKSF